MHVAVIRGNLKIVKLLMEHGANMLLISKVWSFLFYNPRKLSFSCIGYRVE